MYSSSRRKTTNVEKQKMNGGVSMSSSKRSQKRIKKISDVTGSCIVQNNERVESWSFCQGHHRITTCIKKSDKGKECNGNELIQYLKEDATYTILNSLDRQRIITSDIYNTKTSRHMIIHMMHTRVSHEDEDRWRR